MLRTHRRLGKGRSERENIYQAVDGKEGAVAARLTKLSKA